MTADRSSDFDVRGKDVPRELFPEGRVRFSLGTTNAREARRRRDALQELRHAQEWEILRAIADDVLSVAEVARRLKQGGEAAIPELRGDVHRRRMGAIPSFGLEAGLDQADDDERDTYLRWYARKKGDQSFRNVRSRLKRLGEQTVGDQLFRDLPLTAIRREDAERAIDAVSSSPGTQHGLRAAGSGLFTWSIGRESERARAEHRTPRWSVNPFSGIELEERTHRVETASVNQVLDLLAAAQLYQQVYVRVFSQIGLRLTEFSHTRLHLDLDLERWAWMIQPRDPDKRCGCSLCRGKGWSPKTKHGIRSFIVPAEQEELRATIAAYLEAHPCEPGDFAFRNPRTDRVWDSSTLRVDFMALCEKAGVRYGRDVPGGIVIHDLRHTAATELVRSEIRESVIAALLGDTVETIVSTYVHLTPDDLGRGMARGPRYE